MTSPPQRALVLTDRKSGHENQSKALCEGLGLVYDVVEVAYPARWRKAFSYLADRLGLSLPGIFRMDPIPSETYSCVIGTGSTTFYPVKCLARQLDIASVAILYPRGYRLNDFTVIAAPVFDTPEKRANLIEIPINITRCNDEFYRSQTEAFLKCHTPKKKAVAVILGGPNPSADFSPEWVAGQLRQIFAATPEHEHWVTTSRRTPPEIDAVIEQFSFDYRLIFSKDPSFNPIPAFVTLCENVFVTAESTGMVSEAVTLGQAGVEVLMNIRKPDSKFGRFISALQAGHHLHIFDGTLGIGCKPVEMKPVFSKIADRLYAFAAVNPENRKSA